MNSDSVNQRPEISSALWYIFFHKKTNNMEPLDFLQPHLRYLGISPWDSTKYIASIGISYGSWISNICTAFRFYLYSGRTPAERSNSLFAAMTFSLIIFWHFAFTLQRKVYAKLLEDLNAFIEKSNENTEPFTLEQVELNL